MRIRDIAIATGITVFIVAPAILSLSAFVLTKNPNLRPFGVTQEKLAEAGLLADKGLIIAVVDLGSKAPKKLPKSDYRDALETAFDRMDTSVRVKFREAPGRSDVKVTYIVGESVVGPYPISKASHGINAALQAEKATIKYRQARMSAQEESEKFAVDRLIERWFK